MRKLLDDLSGGLRGFSPSRFPYLRFLMTIGIGLTGALIFVYLKTPLPWVLGSMTATTIAALAGRRVTVPSVVRTPMVLVVGVVVGATFTPEVLVRFPDWWPTVVGLLILGAVSGAICVGYLRTFTDFDMPTAYFSGMPGGLVEMVTLGEDHGADVRAIALMHSVRILIIVFAVPIVVSLIEGVTVQTSSVARPSIVDIELADYAWLAVTAVAGAVIGHILRMPAVYLLGPLSVSAVIHAIGISEFTLPVEILNLAQLVIGTSIGCRFAGVASMVILRLFGQAIGMTIVLLAVTAIFAVGATQFSEFGFVPILLAYAPGGVAEMSLVAVALHIEVAFVASHHIVRLFFVMAGAPLAYAFVRKSK